MRGESARPGKRPLRALSASEKMEAIQRVHEGESKASVARDIGVPESTLRGWCKSEHKIRGMARNSSTPDSEAHSPASSSGANPLTGMAGTSNLSSEDEGMGGPSAKKMKLDDAESNEAIKLGDKSSATAPKMDYMSSLISSLVAGGVRSDNSSLLLQQLGMLSSAQSAANLTKMLNYGTTASLASPTAAHLSTQQAVGLVENGLQYTKNSAGSNGHKRSSTSSLSHISAIAPTSALDCVSKSRKSLPPAAEAPLTPVPASPRKTNEYQNGALNLQTSQSRSSKKDNNGASSGSSSMNRKADEALWLWLAQQQQLTQLNQTSISPYNPSSGVDGSWFWQWYKNSCMVPNVSSQQPISTSSVSQQQQQQQSTNLSVKKSPSKAKALLDNVLCNNNNDSVRRSLNSSGSDGVDTTTKSEDGDADSDSSALMNSEEAIEHGDKFFKWLERCSDPSVTRLQILQFKFLLDSVKSGKKRTTTASSKHSRK